MSLKTQMVTDKAVFSNTGEFGESVTYTVQGATASTTFNAVVAVNANLAGYVAGSTQAKMGTAEIWKSDIAAPGRYDRLVDAAGNVWAVESVAQEDSAVSTVLLSAEVRAS